MWPGLGVRMPRAHIDLRHVLRGLGLTGGLKKIENCLGLDRPGLHEVDGSVAVLLWDEYRRRGNVRALEVGTTRGCAQCRKTRLYPGAGADGGRRSPA